MLVRAPGGETPPPTLGGFRDRAPGASRRPQLWGEMQFIRQFHVLCITYCSFLCTKIEKTRFSSPQNWGRREAPGAWIHNSWGRREAPGAWMHSSWGRREALGALMHNSWGRREAPGAQSRMTRREQLTPNALLKNAFLSVLCCVLFQESGGFFI